MKLGVLVFVVLVGAVSASCFGGSSHSAAVSATSTGVPPFAVGCDQIILRPKSPFAGGYRRVLGVISVPPAYIPQVVSTPGEQWPYWEKAGMVVRASGSPVTVSVPQAWRTRVAITWGNGSTPAVSCASILARAPLHRTCGTHTQEVFSSARVERVSLWCSRSVNAGSSCTLGSTAGAAEPGTARPDRRGALTGLARSLPGGHGSRGRRRLRVVGVAVRLQVGRVTPGGGSRRVARRTRPRPGRASQCRPGTARARHRAGTLRAYDTRGSARPSSRRRS